MIDGVQVHRPHSLAEALQLLDEHGEDAVPLAGGTELVFVLKLGLSTAEHLVDLSSIPELREIRNTPDGRLAIGACATHWAIRGEPRVQQEWPSMMAMEHGIGNIRVQTTGTLGGNLCFADPESDPATYLTAVGATISCVDPTGAVRAVPLPDFTVGAYATSLRRGELLVDVTLPARTSRKVVVHRKFAFGERPDVTCTVAVELCDDRISTMTMAVGAMTPRPVLSRHCEELHGTGVGDARRSSAALATTTIDELAPDVLSAKASAHSRHVARVLVRRSLEDALTEASARARNDYR